MNTIYLKDYVEEVLTFSENRNSLDNHYNRDLLKQSIQALIDANLRYNLSKGKTLDKSGVIGEYVNSNDIPKFESLEEAACWEFTSYVRNAASRKYRGYEFHPVF